jgi:hypothetical protein
MNKNAAVIITLFLVSVAAIFIGSYGTESDEEYIQRCLKQKYNVEFTYISSDYNADEDITDYHFQSSIDDDVTVTANCGYSSGVNQVSSIISSDKTRWMHDNLAQQVKADVLRETGVLFIDLDNTSISAATSQIVTLMDAMSTEMAEYNIDAERYSSYFTVPVRWEAGTTEVSFYATDEDEIESRLMNIMAM